MEEMDEERRKAQEENREELRRVMRRKIEAKHARIQKSIENNLEIEAQRERDFQMRQEKERERNQRLQDERDLMQEQSAKKQLHMMLKRKCIADEAAGIQEQKRNDMLNHMEDVENRLMDHEMKKERYLEFKRELTSLKEKNKELNVQRQRRRQEHRRELLAESARQKATKMDFVQLERERLWDDRRRTALMSQAYRDRVREIVHAQKLASQFDSSAVEEALRDVLNDPSFNPRMPQSK